MSTTRQSRFRSTGSNFFLAEARWACWAVCRERAVVKAGRLSSGLRGEAHSPSFVQLASNSGSWRSWREADLGRRWPSCGNRRDRSQATDCNAPGAGCGQANRRSRRFELGDCRHELMSGSEFGTGCSSAHPFTELFQRRSSKWCPGHRQNWSFPILRSYLHAAPVVPS